MVFSVAILHCTLHPQRRPERQSAPQLCKLLMPLSPDCIPASKACWTTNAQLRWRGSRAAPQLRTASPSPEESRGDSTWPTPSGLGVLRTDSLLRQRHFWEEPVLDSGVPRLPHSSPVPACSSQL